MQVTKAFLLKSSVQFKPLHSNVCLTRRRCRAEARPDLETSSKSTSAPVSPPTSVSSVVERPLPEALLVGEDAAVFDVETQKTSSWIYFTLVLGVVMAILYFIWLDPHTGFGGAFIHALSSLSSNHEVTLNPNS